MKKAIGLLVVLFICAMVFTGCGQKTTDEGGDTGAPNEEILKVAFVYNAAVGDYGWFYGHDKARKITDEQLSFVETSFLESVQPGAHAERVIKELCDEGIDVIVAASADFEADVVKVASNYPDIKFLICCGTISQEPNIESFYPKTTQVWYMLGQIAGKLTKTNTLGMVGAVVHPIDLQVQNAFLLGAQSVNPDITERIIYINTYYDPAAEKDAALSLIDAGADVIAQATNTPAHVQAAEEKGVFAMSQFEDMRQFGPNAYVSGDVFFWEKYYIPTLEAIKDGTWEPRLYNPDLFSGVCDLAEVWSNGN
ncbi:MAG: BMP family ABC transporter substrate-binding protein [Bacillota bacterium]